MKVNILGVSVLNSDLFEFMNTLEGMIVFERSYQSQHPDYMEVKVSSEHSSDYLNGFLVGKGILHYTDDGFFHITTLEQ